MSINLSVEVGLAHLRLVMAIRHADLVGVDEAAWEVLHLMVNKVLPKITPEWRCKLFIEGVLGFRAIQLTKEQESLVRLLGRAKVAEDLEKYCQSKTPELALQFIVDLSKLLIGEAVLLSLPHKKAMPTVRAVKRGLGLEVLQLLECFHFGLPLPAPEILHNVIEAKKKGRHQKAADPAIYEELPWPNLDE